ncbi:DNA double-strand break repair nuclease NurA [Micromonospora humi]|uniref:NurA domain-containing protein n=1 Tax=Micromonospora humi TaxID=745366 RepID=A0A1C5IPR8_9ACTN|nr:DNA double-strand break repair nuclease NurA [Micromonospora humi]SCG60322.1 NurA domain-containing protein [Micromonospora humi]
MPYETVAGTHELASRLGHSTAAVRAIADQRTFHVPAEVLRDVEEIRKRVRPRSDLKSSASSLSSALAVDGSYVVERVRDGLPSVLYGFAQAAAAYLDLSILETQKAQQFVDPYEIARAVNTALVTLDLPVAGAYTREGVDIATSWREAIDQLFRTKKVEVNRLNQTLSELLFLLHGKPGVPASTVPVNCPSEDCSKDVRVPPDGVACDACGSCLFPTDVLRIHEEVGEEGSNQSALGRLMSVVELLVLVGLATLLWEQSRQELLPTTLFIVDGPLAVYGPPAKLRGRALDYFQAMSATTPGVGPFICGIEKSGAMVDYARQLARHDVLTPGDLLVCDEQIIARVTNATNARAYGKETYWGRKFVYRALDGRVVVPTVMPPSGAPYDANGGQPNPRDYPTLPSILDVIDRTGSSMYIDGVIPVAAAHGKAAFPIGVGTDVLRLVASKRLGLDGTARSTGLVP